jgi:hypothetical protein
MYINCFLRVIAFIFNSIKQDATINNVSDKSIAETYYVNREHYSSINITLDVKDGNRRIEHDILLQRMGFIYLPVIMCIIILFAFSGELKITVIQLLLLSVAVIFTYPLDKKIRHLRENYALDTLDTALFGILRLIKSILGGK